MAYINLNSKPVISTSCDLFSLPPTQRCIEQGYSQVIIIININLNTGFECVYFQEFRPYSSLEGLESPLEFMIPPSGDEYLDLGHSKIRIKVRIVNDKGENLPANSPVAPVNNFLHSLFSNVQVELNQKCITSQSSMYGYKSYIDNILNYGSDARESHLTTSLFYKDTAGAMGACDANIGYKKRNSFATGGEIDLESHIHSDIFNQNKYLLNGVQMGIKFYKSRPEFALMTTEGDTVKYSIKITDAVLIIRKVKMSPALLVAHATTMLKHSARYPITRVEVKNVTIPRGIQSTSLENVFLGQMPQRIIVGFVDSDAFNGSLTTNPFDFQTFNHNFLNVATDSTLHITPLKPNYKSKLYITSYNTLFTQTGINFTDSGVNISREEYPNGYNFSIFDLTPDISAHESHLSAQSSGSLRLEVAFADNLNKPVTCIIFAEFSNLIEIDRHRQVTTDYAT